MFSWKGLVETRQESGRLGEPPEGPTGLPHPQVWAGRKLPTPPCRPREAGQGLEGILSPGGPRSRPRPGKGLLSHPATPGPQQGAALEGCGCGSSTGQDGVWGLVPGDRGAHGGALQHTASQQWEPGDAFPGTDKKSERGRRPNIRRKERPSGGRSKLRRRAGWTKS